MSLTPLHNNILIKLKARPKELKTKGGLYLPDTANPEGTPMQGDVVATGEGLITPKGKLIPPSFKPGDTVVFGKFGGTELQIDGERHIIISENQLVGVLADVKTDD